MTPERLEKKRQSDRRWRAANREKENERKRKYHAANPGRRREYQRAWRAANPEKERGYSRKYRTAYPEKRRASRMRWSHGILPGDWAALWDAQQGLCYLCGEPMTLEGANLDHDHSCCPRDQSCPHCRRGLVHDACNQGIGLFGDDPDKLIRIAENLRAAKKDVAQRTTAKLVQSSLFPEVAS